jgi:C1A family cysteine protease
MSDPVVNVSQVVRAARGCAARWEPGENFLTRMSAEQIARHLGAAIGPNEVPLDQMEPLAKELIAHAEMRKSLHLRLHAAATAAPIPSSIDWRNVNGQSFVTSVKYQGTCGACTAFSSAAAVESAICIATKTSPAITNGVEYPDLSEAQIFYCGGGAAGRTCAAGWYLSAALQYCQDTGVAPESYFPYTSGDQPCALQSGWQSAVTKTTGATKLGDLEQMKTWIASTGPVATMLVIYADFIAYQSGVYHHVSGQKLGAHSVEIIGFDDDLGAWLCKNSWSTQWGEAGFFWIAYGQCGIESAMYGINGLATVGK